MLGESLTHCVSGARKTVHERVNGTKETSGACIPNMFIPVRGSFLSSRRPLLFRETSRASRYCSLVSGVGIVKSASIAFSDCSTSMKLVVSTHFTALSGVLSV